jgi:hypothetical protein
VKFGVRYLYIALMSLLECGEGRNRRKYRWDFVFGELNRTGSVYRSTKWAYTTKSFEYFTAEITTLSDFSL